MARKLLREQKYIHINLLIMYTKDQIKGMLLVLNKLYTKLSAKDANNIIAEAADLPGFKGFFYVDPNTLEVWYSHKNYPNPPYRYKEVRHKRSRKDCIHFFIKNNHQYCNSPVMNFKRDKGWEFLCECEGVNCGEFKFKNCNYENYYYSRRSN